MSNNDRQYKLNEWDRLFRQGIPKEIPPRPTTLDDLINLDKFNFRKEIKECLSHIYDIQGLKSFLWYNYESLSANEMKDIKEVTHYLIFNEIISSSVPSRMPKHQLIEECNTQYKSEDERIYPELLKRFNLHLRKLNPLHTIKTEIESNLVTGFYNEFGQIIHLEIRQRHYSYRQIAEWDSISEYNFELMRGYCHWATDGMDLERYELIYEKNKLYRRDRDNGEKPNFEFSENSDVKLAFDQYLKIQSRINKGKQDD